MALKISSLSLLRQLCECLSNWAFYRAIKPGWAVTRLSKIHQSAQFSHRFAAAPSSLHCCSAQRNSYLLPMSVSCHVWTYYLRLGRSQAWRWCCVCAARPVKAWKLSNKEQEKIYLNVNVKLKSKALLVTINLKSRATVVISSKGKIYRKLIGCLWVFFALNAGLISTLALIENCYWIAKQKIYFG